MALTAQQQIVLTREYITDAVSRGLEPLDMVAELIQVIFLTRAQQKNQLTNLMQRRRNAVTALQNTFTTDSATALTNLNQEGSDLDDVLSAIPTLT